jgi:hypothetical protein
VLEVSSVAITPSTRNASFAEPVVEWTNLTSIQSELAFVSVAVSVDCNQSVADTLVPVKVSIIVVDELVE